MDLNDIYGYKKIRKFAKLMGLVMLPIPLIFIILGFIFLISVLTNPNGEAFSSFKIISIVFISVGFFELILFCSLYFGITRAAFKNYDKYKKMTYQKIVAEVVEIRLAARGGYYGMSRSSFPQKSSLIVVKYTPDWAFQEEVRTDLKGMIDNNLALMLQKGDKLNCLLMENKDIVLYKEPMVDSSLNILNKEA